MQDVVREILDELRARPSIDAAELDRIIRRHSKRAHDGRRVFAKKRILPFYLDVRSRGTYGGLGTSTTTWTGASSRRCR